MRSISADLLAAAQSWTSAPIAKVTIKNKRLRWAELHAGASGERFSDQASQSGLVLRARVDGTNVDTARVTTPGTAAQWVDWTTQVAAGAVTNSDVALCRVSADCFRLFYVATGFDVKMITTPDGGANWGSPSTVVATLGSQPYITASNLYILIQTADLKVYKKPWASGAWNLESTRDTESITTPYGVGMDYDSVGDGLYLIVAGDRKLWAFIYWCYSNAWIGPYWLLPGAEGDPPALNTPKFPDLINTAHDIRVATWIEVVTGSPTAYTRAVLRTSRDGIHFGNEITIPDSPTTWRRFSLASNSTDRYIYAANDRHVFRSRSYDASDSAMNAGPFDVLIYTRRTRDHAPSHLTVTILDPDGDYVGLALAGENAEPFQPLAEVHVDRGYTGAGGDETETLDPHYIQEVTYSQGRNAGHITIRATDGYGLLDSWRPDRSSTWGSRSIAWLLAEVAAQVGLYFSDPETTPFGRTLPYFTWSPITTAAHALDALMRLAGALLYFAESGNPTPAIWPASDPPSKPTIGDQSEILRATYGPATFPLTALHAHSYDYADLAENTTDSMTLGIRLHRSIQDNRIASAAMAQEVTGRDLAVAHAGRRHDTVTIPMRPDVEMWDIAIIEAHTDLVPAADKNRAVIAIEELRDSLLGRLETTLELTAP